MLTSHRLHTATLTEILGPGLPFFAWTPEVRAARAGPVLGPLRPAVWTHGRHSHPRQGIRPSLVAMFPCLMVRRPCPCFQIESSEEEHPAREERKRGDELL